MATSKPLSRRGSAPTANTAADSPLKPQPQPLPAADPAGSPPPTRPRRRASSSVAAAATPSPEPITTEATPAKARATADTTKAAKDGAKASAKATPKGRTRSPAATAAAAGADSASAQPADAAAKPAAAVKVAAKARRKAAGTSDALAQRPVSTTPSLADAAAAPSGPNESPPAADGAAQPPPRARTRRGPAPAAKSAKTAAVAASAEPAAEPARRRSRKAAPAAAEQPPAAAATQALDPAPTPPSVSSDAAAAAASAPATERGSVDAAEPSAASSAAPSAASPTAPTRAPRQRRNPPRRTAERSPSAAVDTEVTASPPSPALAQEPEGFAPAQAPSEPAAPEPHSAAEGPVPEGVGQAAEPVQEAVPAPEPEAAAAATAPAPRRRPAVAPGTPSRWRRSEGPACGLQWEPGDAPDALLDAVAAACGAEGQLPLAAADHLLPLSRRLAAEAGHRLEVDPALWPLLAADRDHRSRAAWLAALYPRGAADPAWHGLLRVRLAPFQAEGALWAVVAGRAVLADEPGLGKGVQAVAAALLWQRHFGLQRVLVLCAPAQRVGWQQAWRQLAGVHAADASGDHGANGANGANGTHGAAAVQVLAWDGAATAQPAKLAEALAAAAPQLLIVDEPQRLALDGAAWDAVAAVPQLLVLCGAALDAAPALLDALVERLDAQRLGPYAAWLRLRAARDAGQALDEAELDGVSDRLSRLLQQRLRLELADQLPPVIHGTRWMALSATQAAAHDALLREVDRLLAPWRRSGHMSDSDQWRLSGVLQRLQHTTLRADPAQADSPLADAVLQAVAGQCEDWAESGAAPVLVRCASTADAQQLAAHLGERPGLHLLAPGQRPQAAVGRVLQLGAPWRLRREPLASDGQPGQHWVTVAAIDSWDQGLLETAAGRGDVPRGPAEPGGQGFLAGERLDAWLQAVDAALAALHLARAEAAGRRVN